MIGMFCVYNLLFALATTIRNDIGDFCRIYCNVSSGHDAPEQFVNLEVGIGMVVSMCTNFFRQYLYIHMGLINGDLGYLHFRCC